MIWKNLEGEVITLGFENKDDESVLGEYLYNIIDASNRAIAVLNTALPVIAHVTFTKADDGIERFKADGRIDHISELTDDGYYPASNYFLENGNTAVISEAGTYEVYYALKPVEITTATAAITDITLDERYEPLAPMLAAYFVWLDDDEEKAILYYNSYLELKKDIDTKIANTLSEAKAVIIGGF